MTYDFAATLPPALPAFVAAPERNRVYQCDWRVLVSALPDASVDAFISDLPYGTTACTWDEIIPFEPMWREVKRTLKPRGVFVTTASQPFTSKLVMSNLEMFKYCWYWEKPRGANFALTGFQPLKVIEDIVVFASSASTFTANGSYMNYYPQKQALDKPYKRDFRNNNRSSPTAPLRNKKIDVIEYAESTPRNLLYFSTDGDGRVHPTQEPVALYEYLIRTYTQPGELVVDFCCGSGTTGVAARNLKRDYIIGDSDAHYCNVARERLRTSILEPHYIKHDEDVTNMPVAEGYKNHLFAAAGE